MVKTSSDLLYRTIPQTSALISSCEKTHTSLLVDSVGLKSTGETKVQGSQSPWQSDRTCPSHHYCGSLPCSQGSRGATGHQVSQNQHNFYTNICILWLLDAKHVCRIISFNFAMEMFLLWLLQIRKWISHWLTSSLPLLTKPALQVQPRWMVQQPEHKATSRYLSGSDITWRSPLSLSPASHSSQRRRWDSDLRLGINPENHFGHLPCE